MLSEAGDGDKEPFSSVGFCCSMGCTFCAEKKRRVRPEQGRTMSEESQEQQRHIPCLAARNATKQGQLSTRQEPLEGAAACSPETLNKLNRVLIQLCLARQQRGGMAEGSRSLRNTRGWVSE